GCKGGAEEGGIQFEGLEDNIYSQGVKVSGEKTFKVKRGGSSAEDDIPGIYGITIEAKIADGGSWQYIDTYNVRVKPKWKPGESYAYHYFDLDKYNFVLLEEGDVESAVLMNRMFEEKVKVRASLYRWKKANKERRLWIALGSAAITYAITDWMIANFGFLGTLGNIAGTAASILGPVGVGISIAIALWGLYEYLSAQHKLHTKMKTHELPDFIINFSTKKKYGDYKGITLCDELKDWLSVEEDALKDYQVVQSELGSNGRLQLTPIVFERTGDYTGDKGVLYGNVEFCATEHIHGDEAHKEPYVDLGDSHTPAIYGILDTAKKTYCQKFHLRFKVAAEKQALPRLDLNTFACKMGGMVGRTGSGALPKVNYTWKWDDIDLDFCSRYYCDAAQFTTVVMKRLYALHKFLEANNYLEGVCPESAMDKAEEENNKSYINGDDVNEDGVDFGKVGFAEFDVNFDTKNNVADVNIVVENKSADIVTVIVKTELKSVETDTAVQSCEETVSINPNDKEVLSCKFDALQEGSYYAIPEIVGVIPSSTEIDDWAEPIAIVVITKPAVAGCDIIKTTERIGGKSVLSYFLDAAKNPKAVIYGNYCITPDDNYSRWSCGNATPISIERLLFFDAKLMRDAFSMDFRQDYINTAGWLGLPTWLKPSESSEAPFHKYLLDNEKMKFMLKYAPNVYRVSAPGQYKIEIVAVFGEENWSFFDESNEPKNAGIGVVFYRYADPVHDSALYYMPLDGKVGLEGGSYERQGYGVGFENLGELINIEGEIQTYPAYASNPITKVVTKTIDDFRTTNVLNRGVVLDIRKTKQGYEMAYAKIVPEPKVITVDAYEPKDEEYIAAYQLLLDNQPQATGPIMTYWNGCGECYDFTGAAIAEVFDYRPDTVARPEDKGITDLQHTYVLRWPLVYKTGTVTLATIFYKPAGKELQIMPVTDNLNVAVDDASYVSDIDSKIGNINKILEGVKNQEICVIDNGVEAKFFWNPAKIYGSTIAVHCIEPDGCIEE
ncbi:MAG: hypothetical protein DRO04_00865, partial [Candidatus Iainarchaeum archaeon]